jgi:tetratricopeptide (TPR) repeat protein
LYIDRNEIEKAKEYANEAINLDDYNDEGYVILGYALFLKGDRALAEKNLLKALKILKEKKDVKKFMDVEQILAAVRS